MGSAGHRLMGRVSLDEGEGEGEETDGGREDTTEVSLLGKINEEEYEGTSVTLETPAKRVKSEVE